VQGKEWKEMESFQLNYSLRQLRYFVVTAEVLSFTAASKLLHISQPSVSAALAEVESSFGVQLFIRHHAQGLSLTQAGRDMLSRARVLLKSAEDLQSAAKELGTGLTGTISLGCMISLAALLIPGLISRFLATHSGINFRIREANQENLLQDLRSGLLDMALTYDLDLTDDIQFAPLFTLPPFAILPKNHRLASAKTVSLEDLSGEPYVMLDLPHSREYFSSLFDVLDTRPVAAFKSSQPEVVKGMVANGLGYSILNFPQRVTKSVDGQEFITRRFRDKLRAMTFGIAYSQGTRPRKIVQSFASFCKEIDVDNEMRKRTLRKKPSSNRLIPSKFKSISS
jgi:DNA-binding transcriptional LysR family regulator